MELPRVSEGIGATAGDRIGQNRDLPGQNLFAFRG